jgi:hypothetical protein
MNWLAFLFDQVIAGWISGGLTKDDGEDRFIAEGRRDPKPTVLQYLARLQTSQPSQLRSSR